MYPLPLFINIHGAGDGHFAFLINTSQLMLVIDAVDIESVPITMLPAEMNISVLLLDKKVSQNVVPFHSRGAQRGDKFTLIYLRVGTNGLK